MGSGSRAGIQKRAVYEGIRMKKWWETGEVNELNKFPKVSFSDAQEPFLNINFAPKRVKNARCTTKAMATYSRPYVAVSEEASALTQQHVNTTMARNVLVQTTENQ